MFDVKAAAKVRISEKKTKFYLSFLEREYLRRQPEVLQIERKTKGKRKKTPHLFSRLGNNPYLHEIRFYLNEIDAYLNDFSRKLNDFSKILAEYLKILNDYCAILGPS
jgi:hypothetical protein